MDFCRMYEEIARRIEENAEYLDGLDAVMGDGEHGLNMKKCFNAVREMLPEWREMGNTEVLESAGMTLLAAGGGTATTLLGFFMMRAAGAAKNETVYDAESIARILNQALASTLEKSQAGEGDKTLMDVLVPAVRAFSEEAANDDIFAAAGAAAKASAEGARATEQMIARRGRGFYVADRGLGTADPGAASLNLIVQTIYKELLKEM